MEDVKDVDNKPRQEDIKKDMGKHQMDVDMEAKFHKWMELMGREYSNQEEKAYRFELFKERMKQIETSTEVKSPLPNGFGDMTDDEIRAITNCHKPRSKEYEASLMQVLLFPRYILFLLRIICCTDNNKPPRHSNQHHKNYILSLVDVDCTCSNRVDPNCLKYLFFIKEQSDWSPHDKNYDGMPQGAQHTDETCTIGIISQ